MSYADALTIDTKDDNPPEIVEITAGQKKLYDKIVPAFFAILLGFGGNLAIGKQAIDDLANFDLDLEQGFDAAQNLILLRVNAIPKKTLVKPAEKQLIIPK